MSGENFLKNLILFKNTKLKLQQYQICIHACIDFLQIESEEIWINASITIYNLYEIARGTIKHQLICRMKIEKPFIKEKIHMQTTKNINKHTISSWNSTRPILIQAWKLYNFVDLPDFICKHFLLYIILYFLFLFFKNTVISVPNSSLVSK